jgi:hypothetical protein
MQRRSASAADLKSLHRSLRTLPRDFKSISGTGIIWLLVPSYFSKLVSEVAATYHELRKAGTSLSMSGVALLLFAAPLPASAAENDDVLKVVDDVCVNHRDAFKDVGTRLPKLGFGTEVERKRGPPPVTAAWLPKLGTGSILTFSAKKDSEPVHDCRLVSHVGDLADLVARLKAKFELSEPAKSEASVQLTMKGEKTIGGKAYAVELVYGFEENKPSGAFTLTTHR